MCPVVLLCIHVCFFHVFVVSHFVIIYVRKYPGKRKLGWNILFVFLQKVFLGFLCKIYSEFSDR